MELMLQKVKEKLESFKNRLAKIPPEYRRWSAFGILLALLFALPLTIWGLTSSGSFELRKRAATAEAIPTPTPSPRSTISAYLVPEGNFTPNARGRLTIEIAENPNGYWDFVVSGNLTKLLPKREYQLWFCGINCSSHKSARVITDNSGNASFSQATINGHNQRGDPVRKIKVWEVVPPGGKIPPNTCVMISNNSLACLASGMSPLPLFSPTVVVPTPTPTLTLTPTPTPFPWWRFRQPKFPPKLGF